MAIVIPSFSIGPVPFLPKFGISGFSCKWFPTPCPTSSLTTPKLCCLAYVSIALDMSPTWLPGLTCLSPSNNAFSVCSNKYAFSRETLPTW